MKRALVGVMVVLFFASLTLAAGNRPVTVRSTPPVVVKTVPQAGDLQVDPALTEIQVTFSKKMTDGSWSWSSVSNETTPEMPGEPHYLKDKKTCVLPVKLEPGHAYAFWLNSEQFHGFASKEGQPAVPYLLVFETKK